MPHLGKSGTLWVDDIAITLSDLTSVLDNQVAPRRQEIARNNRISFPRQTSFTFEEYAVNGKALRRSSSIVDAVDLNHLDLSSGVYLIRAKTREKTYFSRMILSK
jgi:hypothetical protein